MHVDESTGTFVTDAGYCGVVVELLSSVRNNIGGCGHDHTLVGLPDYYNRFTGNAPLTPVACGYALFCC